MRRYLHAYTPPSWAASLPESLLPKSRLQLAQTPTPIQPVPFHAFKESGFEVSVKRDDLTGGAMNGNKIRKLEFLLAEAIEQDADMIATFGGTQSNHCRTTAIAARELGLDSLLFLRAGSQSELKRFGSGGDGTVAELAAFSGNTLVDLLAGARTEVLPKKPYMENMVDMEARLAALREEGRRPYFIPVGGSNARGVFGYLEGVAEMVEQGVADNFDDIVVATGSGGTAAGLAIGVHLAKLPVKVHAVAVCDDAAYFYDHVDEMLEKLQLTDTKARDILDVVEGYKGRGYGLASEEELDMLVDVAGETGLLLDPVYTNKAFRGMVLEMQRNPTRFQGRRVLFVHTGGYFGGLFSHVQVPGLAEALQRKRDGTR